MSKLLNAEGINLKFFSRVVYFWTGFFLKRLNTELAESTEKLEKGEESTLCVVGIGAQDLRCKQWSWKSCEFWFVLWFSSCIDPCRQSIINICWSFKASSLPLPKSCSSCCPQLYAKGSKTCWSSSSSMAEEGNKGSRSACLVRVFLATSAPKSSGLVTAKGSWQWPFWTSISLEPEVITGHCLWQDDREIVTFPLNSA